MCVSQCAQASRATLNSLKYALFTLCADTLDNRRYLQNATNDHHYYYSVKIESETQRGLC